MFAFIDIVIGWSLIDDTLQAQAKAVPAYKAMLTAAPLDVWGWIWISIAVICIAQAFARFDGVGFGAAISVKVAWAGGFLASWLIYDAPRAWLGAATWVVLAALVRHIARWPEPAVQP